MSVRIAYLILAHKAPSHLVRLVTRLQGPECTFVIHLDSKSAGPDWDEACEKLRQPNIFWAERVDCEWGDFSLVQATLNAIGKLYSSARPFDFAVLLSGQDYPVKSNSYIESHLASRHGECLMYLNRFPNREWSWKGYYRLPTWRMRLAGKSRRMIPVFLSRQLHRNVPLGYVPYGGSMWWALPKSALDHVRGVLAAYPEFISYFKQAIIPDEMMFHTILGNSPFPVKTGDHYLHFMKWGSDPHPAILTGDDLSALGATEKCFARKFDGSVDEGILDAIDREFLGSSPLDLSRLNAGV